MNVVGTTLMLLGALGMLAGAVGLHRFGDVYARLHVAGSATTAGAVPLLLGAALMVDGAGAATKLVLAAVFLLATTPAATQALARAAVHADLPTDTATRLVLIDRQHDTTHGAPPAALPHEGDDDT